MPTPRLPKDGECAICFSADVLHTDVSYRGFTRGNLCEHCIKLMSSSYQFTGPLKHLLRILRGCRSKRTDRCLCGGPVNRFSSCSYCRRGLRLVQNSLEITKSALRYAKRAERLDIGPLVVDPKTVGTWQEDFFALNERMRKRCSSVPQTQNHENRENLHSSSLSH